MWQVILNWSVLAILFFYLVVVSLSIGFWIWMVWKPINKNADEPLAPSSNRTITKVLKTNSVSGNVKKVEEPRPS